MRPPFIRITTKVVNNPCNRKSPMLQSVLRTTIALAIPRL
uniref:Uncharacterized protein n=1 Tax=Myoviridae sp. ctPVE25 TaxID=2826649 RepID=A0A8S5R0X0_9CAUD|nr:MAG TPA: hypothetical protein [Myoviridae sp. ctPVE25]